MTARNSALTPVSSNTSLSDATDKSSPEKKTTSHNDFLRTFHAHNYISQHLYIFNSVKAEQISDSGYKGWKIVPNLLTISTSAAIF